MTTLINEAAIIRRITRVNYRITELQSKKLDAV